jgi:hypothetical protein
MQWHHIARDHSASLVTTVSLLQVRSSIGACRRAWSPPSTQHNNKMAAFWDIVGKAASLLQLLGVDAITLVAIAASFLRFHEMNKECRKLEDRVRMLRLHRRKPTNSRSPTMGARCLRVCGEARAWPRGCVICEAASTPIVTSSSPLTPSSSSWRRTTLRRLLLGDHQILLSWVVRVKIHTYI